MKARAEIQAGTDVARAKRLGKIDRAGSKTLAELVVTNYITHALGHSKAVQIDPNKIFMAARFQGLQVRSRSINQAIRELMQ